VSRFESKVALITGAASGIGRAVARRLCDEGATVFAVDVDETGLTETAASVDGRMVVRRADVGDRATCAGLVADCVAELGRLDVIVNIACNSGIQGVPYSAAYSASKGGIIQLTRSLAVEHLKTPLRVNAVAPAGTNTNIAAGASFPADMDTDLAVRVAGLRGMAEPEEVAGVFAFLASDEARSVTGAVYTIDNGITVS